MAADDAPGDQAAGLGATPFASLEGMQGLRTQPRPVGSAQDIVLGQHGIILRKGGRSALYLPQVAPEQGWNLEQTLSSLSRKAGLPADAWKDGTSFSVFEAEVFGEPER